MRKQLFVPVVGILALLAPSAKADFELTIRSSTGGGTVTVVDNGAGDSDPTTGVINSTTSAFTGWTLLINIGTSKPVTGNPPALSSMDIAITAHYGSSTSPALPASTLTVDLTDTDFPTGGSTEGTLTGVASGAIGGGGGSQSFSVFAGPNSNYVGVPSLGGPAATLSVGPLGNNTGPVSVSGTVPNPFAMTLHTVLSANATSRHGQDTFSIDNSGDFTPAPVPGGIVLLATGLPFAGLLWRRRRQAAA